MDMCWLHHTFWELLSMLTLTLVGIFWLIERASTQRFPMNKLLVALAAVAATAVVWVKIELAVPAYRLEGIVDLILGLAMTLLVIHFFIVLIRASTITVPAFVERWSLVLAVVAWVAYALYLFAFGQEAHFAVLDATVDLFLRPFWIIALAVLLIRSWPGSAA